MERMRQEQSGREREGTDGAMQTRRGVSRLDKDPHHSVFINTHMHAHTHNLLDYPHNYMHAYTHPLFTYPHHTEASSVFQCTICVRVCVCVSACVCVCGWGLGFVVVNGITSHHQHPPFVTRGIECHYYSSSTLHTVCVCVSVRECTCACVSALDALQPVF